jgi:hypothetical protein
MRNYYVVCTTEMINGWRHMGRSKLGSLCGNENLIRKVEDNL